MPFSSRKDLPSTPQEPRRQKTAVTPLAIRFHLSNDFPISFHPTLFLHTTPPPSAPSRAGQRRNSPMANRGSIA
jgi:hypothetical protein